ncbi:MAG: protein kinase [Vicinamibacterales bacterium]
MSLTAGSRLGPYEVISGIGAGGMGQVYRARDTRLDRIVAVKVLTPSLADDPLFRERFEREAKTVSSLSHPHICTLHDVGSQNGVEFLVMEYLEGETLADRIARGPLSVDEVLRLATQIAGALERAHREGIVHRDLKPGNIMLVRSGTTEQVAKLLDFGLAKQASSGPVGVTVTSPVVATAPRVSEAEGAGITRASVITTQGTILGTFRYMPPEQLEGREADARSDIWAFGCVLYEMLTARPPFEGTTQAGLIAAILERRPRPLDLPSPLAPGFERVIGACLEKHPEDRFQTVRDVRRELEWLRSSPAALPTAAGPRGSMLAWAALVSALLVVVTAIATWRLRPDAASPPATIFNVTLQPNDTIVGSTTGIHMTPRPSVSPDGSHIAFIAPATDGDAIWLRVLADPRPQQVKGTTGARGVFWSPDGRSIGFFAAGKLKTIELATGRQEIICDAPAAFGGTWGSNDTILFSPDERSPIYKVSAGGGTPAPVTTLDKTRQDQAHRWPQFLPDGRHFIYMPWTDGRTNRPIQLAALDDTPPRTLFEAQSAAVVAGEYLLYITDMPSRLMARRFDLKTLQADDAPFTAVADDNVDYSWMTGEPGASAGGDVIVYTTGKYRLSRLTWVDRTGRALGTIGETGAHFDPRVSPDGTMVALEKHDWTRGSGDVWIVDPARGVFSRLTSAPGYETTPVWSPDGQRIAFASDQGTVPQIYVRNATGTGAEDVLVSPPARSFPTDWSLNGRHVLFMLNGGATRTDIWIYELGTRKASPLLASSFDEGWATFSPDGKWIAYVSDENQQSQVYARSFPDGEFKTQISTAGGAQPQWRRDGLELFYIAPDNTLMSVAVQPSAGRLRATAPRALFTARVEQGRTIRNQYAVSPDGQRFLMLSAVDAGASPIVAVLNWRSSIKK